MGSIGFMGMFLVTTEKPIYFVLRVGAHTYTKQTEACPQIAAWAWQSPRDFDKL